MISIVGIKEKIHKIENKTSADNKVLQIVNTFYGCSDNWVKANMASRISRYVGCKAWKIVMKEVYEK